MDKEKFTPGEWGTDEMYIYHGEDKIVCQMWGSGDSKKANAHLIATAPELYSVLKEWVDYKADGGFDALFELEILKSMKKVLKKARGEE